MENLNKINVIIADDSPEFIEGLSLMISKDLNLKILDICNNGLELINSSYLWQANLLLIDIEMPIMNGLDAAMRINYKRPELTMVALTMHKEKVYLYEIISAGFKGFIHKPNVPNQLFEVIHAVMNNRFVFPKDLNIDENIRK